MLSELLAGLIESLPEDAYPGEDNAEVVLDMLVGSIRPVVEAAGGESAHSATTLIADAAERTLDHLRQAAQLARHGQARRAGQMTRRSRLPC